MDRNTRIMKIGDKTIGFYDYYITNSCIVKFVDANLDSIKDFFGTGIISSMQEVNSDGKILKEENFYFKRKNIFIENTTIIERELKIIKDAYDEEVTDNVTGETNIIHHEAEVETIENVIPVEMTSVILEKPEIEDEISIVKDNMSAMAAEIAGMQDTGTVVPEITACLKVVVENTSTAMTNAQALAVIDFIPEWIIGKDYIVGDKVVVLNDNGEKELYSCISAHTSQENWKPSQATASLWVRIEPDHAGTKDDPIPYHINMIVYKDKYYTENGILYICTRDSGNALQHNITDLIGHYFSKV